MIKILMQKLAQLFGDISRAIMVSSLAISLPIYLKNRYHEDLCLCIGKSLFLNNFLDCFIKRTRNDAIKFFGGAKNAPRNDGSSYKNICYEVARPFAIMAPLFCFSILFCSHLSFANQMPEIGSVISLQGQVAALSGTNTSRALQRRSAIYLKDRIVTQAQSKIQLKLKDDSVIVVQSSSEFYVSEFVFKENNPKQNKYVGNIVKGALINISGRGETENYELNSPLTTIAFRGTGLSTKLISKSNKLVNQEIQVFEGAIIVKNKCTTAFCQPEVVNMGVGYSSDFATINVLGNIRVMDSSSPQGESYKSNMVLTTQDGKPTVKCG